MEITDILHVSGLSHHSTQEPQKNIFHSCQQWQKAPKYCWVTAATDVAHVSISGKATNVCRKHCLKKCQFPSLANSSACFQIQRSSFSSSRDQFDRQILLIPKCVISLCNHLPFYLECWLESDPGANRNVNINLLKLFISENWKRQTCLLIYTLSPLVQMLETFTVPSAMYTCHSWKWQMWDDPQLHFVGREKHQWYFSQIYRKGKSLKVVLLSNRHGQQEHDGKNTIWNTRNYLRRGYS